MTDIEKAKAILGKQIREIADGVGALNNNPTHSEELCIKDFEEGVGEWVYELIKKIVLDGSDAQADLGVPKFLVLDGEESWADYITSERFIE